ncbi:hypothetical protein [Flavobacterium sp.]|uniref:hypothetical protein n=1 Tax=Flavobacterium sp. TaxID=239 RepID=UPI003266E364
MTRIFKPRTKGVRDSKKLPPLQPTLTGNAGPHYADDLSLEQAGSRYDSENLDKESDSASKDITEKDTQEDLIDNDPPEGSQTDIDTQRSDENESNPFETIEPNKDNPVKREFEIGELCNEELREDESARDETDRGTPGNYKPSQRKF